MRLITLSALFRLARFWNLVIIAIAQYFAAAFLLHLNFSVFSDWQLFVLSLSTVLIAAAGYIINDYYDIKIVKVDPAEKAARSESKNAKAAQLRE